MATNEVLKVKNEKNQIPCKKKICVITGTRAEYGLLRHLMKAIKDSDEFELQIIATGMHLSKKFGLTYKEIEADGFVINSKVEILLVSDTPVSIAKSTALGLMGISESLNDLNPDMVLVLGDRFEILSAATAAMFARIPIAHLHGGELTEGLIDEAIRHSITKLSHLHFVAAEEYQQRVIQLGENPKNVFMVGGLGVDSIKRLKLLSREELETSLGIKFNEKNLIVTYHPVTLEKSSAGKQMKELLDALAELKDTQLIFTMPNADTDGRILFTMIEDFVENYPNACVFTSLGQLLYLSCVAQVDGIVGNSSSGLSEVPTFKKATVNIGERQRGRLQASSIINCEPSCTDISNALAKIYDKNFQETLIDSVNPYGDGGAVDRIVKILKSMSFNNLVKKTFYDLNLL